MGMKNKIFAVLVMMISQFIAGKEQKLNFAF